MKSKLDVTSWTRPEADAVYGEHFGHYMRNVRQDTKRADAYAYRQTRAQFPKLPQLAKRKASR